MVLVVDSYILIGSYCIWRVDVVLLLPLMLLPFPICPIYLWKKSRFSSLTLLVLVVYPSDKMLLW